MDVFSTVPFLAKETKFPTNRASRSVKSLMNDCMSKWMIVSPKDAADKRVSGVGTDT